MTFFLDQDSIDAIGNVVGGRTEATLGDVFETQREADIAGGQSFSEADGMEKEFNRLLDQVEGETGTRPDIAYPYEAVFSFLRDEDTFDRDVRGIARVKFEENKGKFEQFRRDLDQLNIAHPTLGADFGEMRDRVAEEARKKFDLAQETASRASGFDSFVGSAGAGVVTAANEPLNQALFVVTLPIAVEALAGSLLFKLGAIAVTEGAIGASSEFVIQNELKDFYKRQGFTDEQIDERIRTSVLSAGAGGAVLGPMGFGIGRGISKAFGKGTTKSITKIQSDNPKVIREGLDEIERSAGDALTITERADIENIKHGLKIQESLPPNVEATPANIRAHATLIDEVVGVLEGTRSPAPLRDRLLNTTANGDPILGIEPSTARVAAAEATGRVDDMAMANFSREAEVDGAQRILTVDDAIERALSNARQAERVARRGILTGETLPDVSPLEVIPAIRTKNGDIVYDMNSSNAVEVAESHGLKVDDGEAGFIADGQFATNKRNANRLAKTARTRLENELATQTDDVAQTIRSEPMNRTNTAQASVRSDSRNVTEPTPSISNPEITARIADGDFDDIISHNARTFLDDIDSNPDIDADLKVTLRKDLDDIMEEEKAIDDIRACLTG